VNRAQLRTALDMIYADTDGDGAENLHALGKVDLPDICVLVKGENGVGFLSHSAADPRVLGTLLMVSLESLLDSAQIANEPMDLLVADHDPNAVSDVPPTPLPHV